MSQEKGLKKVAEKMLYDVFQIVSETCPVSRFFTVHSGLEQAFQTHGARVPGGNIGSAMVHPGGICGGRCYPSLCLPEIACAGHKVGCAVRTACDVYAVRIAHPTGQSPLALEVAPQLLGQA